MVRAILDGRKTQTRRIVKPQPLHVTPFMTGQLGGEKTPTGEFGLHLNNDRVIEKHVRCPYGQPGDRLWVREACYVESIGTANGYGRHILYRATDQDAPVSKWTPSIHMPRWASRITLEVESVRVERLQDISEEDAIAEGIECWEERGVDDAQDYYRDYITGGHCYNPIASYRSLWESINGPGSWEANPWVWVITFKRVKP